MSHANEFLAAFAAGVTVASLSEQLPKRFHAFGEILSELMKLAALLIFGSLLSPTFLSTTTWQELAFATAAIVVVRPVALLLALLGSDLPWPQRLVAAWFGPKGFASVVFGLIILHSSLTHARYLAHLIALVVAGSIIAHSSTDVPIARWLNRRSGEDAPRRFPSQRQGGSPVA